MKLTYGHCTLALQLTADSPLLLPGGLDVSDGAPIGCTDNPAHVVGRYYIPATTLKGALRAGMERIVRCFAPCSDGGPLSQVPRSDCMGCPFLETTSVSDEIKPRGICPIVFLFGSVAASGALIVKDMLCDGSAAPISRSQVAIHRASEAADDAALRTWHALPAGTTFGPGLVVVKSFALWHIGLLALVLRDMSRGGVRLGRGCSRGLGHVSVDVKKVALRYAREFYGDEPRGLCDAQPLRRDADRQPFIMSRLKPTPTDDPADSFWIDFTLNTQADINDLLTACVQQRLVPLLNQGRR